MRCEEQDSRNISAYASIRQGWAVSILSRSYRCGKLRDACGQEGGEWRGNRPAFPTSNIPCDLLLYKNKAGVPSQMHFYVMIDNMSAGELLFIGLTRILLRGPTNFCSYRRQWSIVRSSKYSREAPSKLKTVPKCLPSCSRSNLRWRLILGMAASTIASTLCVRLVAQSSDMYLTQDTAMEA